MSVIQVISLETEFDSLVNAPYDFDIPRSWISRVTLLMSATV